VAKFVDILLSPLVILLGVVRAVIRTLYWGLIVTPAALIVSLLISAGSTPKPIMPLLRALGREDLHEKLGEILFND